MSPERPLRIGITCYPTVGGSGVLASALGEELARRGHHIHFISYERPFRLPTDAPRLHFHPVAVNDYELFKYRDYTLPLSVRMAEVSREHRLDILHVHYAVPHATAAVLARSMLPPELHPRIVTTLHGTDTTLLGQDSAYRPAILHALQRSDAVTTVSAYLRSETERVLGFTGPMQVIHNFYSPRPPRRSPEEVRQELGLDNELVIVHSSNLRPLKRIDLLLETAARIQSHQPWKLLILAGNSFREFEKDVARLNLHDRILVREKVNDIEDYLQIADLALYTSDSESFCLGILEAMLFQCPSVATRVGGVPEVMDANTTGFLEAPGDADALARAVGKLLDDAPLRNKMGVAAQNRGQSLFSPDIIVPQYEALYRAAKKIGSS